MGYDAEKEVLIPAWRMDILHEVDIIEDIAIAYGYDKFNPEIPQISTIGEEDKTELLKRKISSILTGLNMLEISTLHLITKEDAKKMDLKGLIEVEESKSDYKILKPNQLVSALKVLSENTDKEYPQRIFEMGGIFESDEKEETKIKEKENLAITLTNSNFTEIKQILDYLASQLSFEYSIKSAVHPSFIEGRAGSIIIDNKEIGIIGEISPQVLSNFNLEVPVAALELNIDSLLDFLKK